MMADRSVIVAGGGLAGAAAALKLAKAGKRVTLLEAQARLGGRAYARAFDKSETPLEFGGGWITPWHHRLRALVAEHGLDLRPRHPVTHRLWLRDGALHGDSPASPADVTAHERAIARVAIDAILLKKGFSENEAGQSLRGLSFETYLDRLGCPASTRGLFSAWWTVSGNGDHKTVAATEFLASCAYDNGLAEGMIRFWSNTVTPGMSTLAERMIKASGARVIMSAPVSRVTQTAGGVAVVAGGQTHYAQGIILALGLNQLKPLQFTPDLSPGKQSAIALGHGGRAFKLWIKAESVAVGTLVTGNGTGLEFAFAERQADDGSTLIVAFGLTGKDNHPQDFAWVKAQAETLFPGARILSHDWHDWVKDPFALGAWVAALVGHEAGFEPDNWRPEGSIAFASSDYARDQAGWFEGAVISGEDAADAILALTRTAG